MIESGINIIRGIGEQKIIDSTTSGELIQNFVLCLKQIKSLSIFPFILTRQN